MKLSAGILYDALAKHTEVKSYGRLSNKLSLNPPVFFHGEMKYQSDNVYIGRSGELPEPDEKEECLIICVGGELPGNWNCRRSGLFVVSPEMDLLTVFNILQDTFVRYTTWSDALWLLLDNKADYTGMIHLTSAFLNRWISLTDKKLETIASSVPSSQTKIESVTPFEQVKGFADSHLKNTEQHKPFLFGEGEYCAYCTNIFIKNEYFGILSVQGAFPELSSTDKLIIDYFTQIIIKAVKKAVRNNSRQLITLRTVISDLLNCYPVSERRTDQLQEEHLQNKEVWLCAVLSPSASLDTIPIDYFCMQLEAHFEQAYAVPFAEHVVFLIPVKKENLTKEGKFSQMEDIFQDLDLHAGVSEYFDKISKVREYYRQAMITLQFLQDQGQKKAVLYFRDIALNYVLQNSVGELRPEYLIPKELLYLQNGNEYGQEYWDTLKAYLDHEMNAAETARVLFIHRTTFLRRLEKIQELIDLSTPQKRLFIWYSMYMYEAFENK